MQLFKCRKLLWLACLSLCKINYETNHTFLFAIDFATADHCVDIYELYLYLLTAVNVSIIIHTNDIPHMLMRVQMPVQSECYHKVKAVCDRLAMLAAQCCEAQFEKRFRFLDTVCKLWSGSYDQSKAVLSHDTCHPNNADVSAVNLLEQSEVDTVTHSEDSISSTVEVNLLTDDCSKQRNSVQRQLGMFRIHWNVLHC